MGWWGGIGRCKTKVVLPPFHSGGENSKKDRCKTGGQPESADSGTLRGMHGGCSYCVLFDGDGARGCDGLDRYPCAIACVLRCDRDSEDAAV